MLARIGRDVLVLDLSAEGAAAQEYLGPFLAEETTGGLGRDAAAVLPASPREVGGSAIRLRRFVVGPGRLDILQAGMPEHVSVAALRQVTDNSDYAYVLIDAPADRTGATPSAVVRESLASLAAISDRLVVCLNPQSHNLHETAELTADLCGRIAEQPAVSLVVSHFGEAVEQAERTRQEAEAAFEPFVGARRLITLPTQHYWDYLAILKESPGGALPEAYGRLLHEIAPHERERTIQRPQTLSNRYLATMDRRMTADSVASRATAEPREPVAVLHHPADQQIVEWLAGQLGAHGLDARPCPVPPGAPIEVPDGSVIAVVSRHRNGVLAGLPADVRTGERELVVIQVDEELERLPSAIPASVVHLDRAQPAKMAATRLFAALGLSGVARPVGAAGGGPGALRLFGEPRLRNPAPAKEEMFFGRDKEIREIRRLLTQRHKVTVSGPGGIGKTALVLDYLERFRAEYDTVWWIAAHDIRVVRAKLAELGHQLNVRPRGNLTDATLDLIAAGRAPRGVVDPGKCLLVYDGVTDPARLTPLLPSGGDAHVVITTRHGGDGAGDDNDGEFVLGPLAAEEGVIGLAALFERNDGELAYLTDEEARQVVSAAGRSGAALRLASTYLRNVVNAEKGLGEVGDVSPLRRTLGAALSRVNAVTAGVDCPEAALLELVLEQLLTDPYGARAQHLAEMCAYLSPDGIDLRLLRAPAMLTQFVHPDRGGVREGITADDIDRTMWTGARFGLFDVRWSEDALLRTVPAFESLLLERLSPEQREQRREQVRRGLAGVAVVLPWEGETRMRSAASQWTRSIYQELQRHFDTCEAAEAGDPAIREWVVRQLRFLVRNADQSDLRYVRPLMEALYHRWFEEFRGEELTLRLANELTNVYRGLGRFREAMELDRRMLTEYGSVLGRDHFRILVLRGGITAAYRAMGEFDAAIAEEESIRQHFAATHGPGHPDTLTASHNLAVSQFLSGFADLALATERKVYAGRLHLLGPQATQTLWSEMECGIYTREVGDYTAAVGMLETVEQRMHEAHLDRAGTHRLRARRHLAIARRLADDPAADPEVMEQILRMYEELFGPDHPQTWATRLSLAAEAHHAGKHEQATRLAGEVLAHYESDLGDTHPFTAATRANLAVYQQHAEAYPQALANARRAHDALASRLGAPHPWTLTALLGRVLVEAGQQEKSAVDHAGEALSLASEFLSPEHPILRVASLWSEELRRGASAAALRVPGAVPARHIDITIPET
ncbi:FxSxx-COOH system tetratricopeptide repeat protein [Actinoplanes sp. NEAU-A12]|uniref:FxSxx-COOH system tetratricopeptide repeat protein n=1 Tax=Actinoplanes sandaracinus TaxID=3045177 RepID=A0ABT6WW87_9ACTN|nr:FxSxx-COOH system tetratricopeptide repeat protein [Actinoplanes sandaracinus]MDI6104012.1 FxSxx-COOH system tetratricopeptide repeat protein [Actinoplanes sandaracinus]